MQARLIITPPASGFRNMAVDEAILTHGLPTLRFYQWEPACLSVGYFQNIMREIDLSACRKFGIDVVRRITGGKAVLHEHELTYSLVVPENHLGPGIIQSYQAISRVFAAALGKLGIPVQIRARADHNRHSPLCFQAVSFYEIVLNGKKVVGSAQTRKNGMLLQHGSILLDVDFAKLAACLKTAASGDNALYLEKSLTGINRESRKRVTINQLQNAIVSCFNIELNFDLEESGISEGEQEMAWKLEKEKYSSEAWNFKTRGVSA